MVEAVTPLLIIGLGGVVLYFLSSQALVWLEKNPLKVAGFFIAVIALFLIIRLSPALGDVLRRLLVPVVCK